MMMMKYQVLNKFLTKMCANVEWRKGKEERKKKNEQNIYQTILFESFLRHQMTMCKCIDIVMHATNNQWDYQMSLIYVAKVTIIKTVHFVDLMQANDLIELICLQWLSFQVFSVIMLLLLWYTGRAENFTVSLSKCLESVVSSRMRIKKSTEYNVHFQLE